MIKVSDDVVFPLSRQDPRESFTGDVAAEYEDWCDEMEEDSLGKGKTNAEAN